MSKILKSAYGCNSKRKITVVDIGNELDNLYTKESLVNVYQNKWTKEEDEIIFKYIGKKSYSEIALMLRAKVDRRNYSACTVLKRVHRLKIQGIIDQGLDAKVHQKKWIKEELDFLIENIDKKAKDIALLMNDKFDRRKYSIDNVLKKIENLFVKGKISKTKLQIDNKRWTNKEIDFVIKNYKLHYSEISKKLRDKFGLRDYTKDAIYKQISNLRCLGKI